jgi:hypothetical protein
LNTRKQQKKYPVLLLKKVAMGGKQIWGVNNLEIDDLTEFFDGEDYKTNK